VAGDIGFVIESAVEAHKDARLALPGEDGLDAVFSALAKSKDIDWSKVWVVPTADRLAPLEDTTSNYRRLEGRFGGLGAEILSLVDESALDNPAEAARLADARLALLRWPLDLVCLGVNDSGGTAGLFNGPELERVLNAPRERRAVAVRAPDGDRLTLTASALTTARALMIVVTGAEKRQMLEQALKEGPLSSAPIGRLLAGVEVPVDIFWCPEG
ncbi:MAG: pgl, partial [Alphaproteobacteria bacterium]|nr:pgl [Alphaproteobacteria bacterium]